MTVPLRSAEGVPGAPSAASEHPGHVEVEAHGTPGSIWDRTSGWGRALGSVDDAADRWLDHLRGVPLADAAATVVSNLADYGFAWAVLAAVKARKPGPSRRRALVALAVAGVVSAGVNSGVKRAVGRQRPSSADASSTDGDARGTDGSVATASRVLPVRRPRSSSFPSGHTLAAFCTAVVLPDGRAERTASLAFATAVAASRVHLRAHHASDVVGGALIGTVAGTAARRLVAAVVRDPRP